MQNNIFVIKKAKQGLIMAKELFLLFIKHCKQDKITVSAGHLAYVSLLSLVPFVMVFFTILSAFPAFSDARGELEELIFSSFVPHAGGQVQTYVTEFVNNAWNGGNWDPVFDGRRIDADIQH